jgi:VanZ family protein
VILRYNLFTIIWAVVILTLTLATGNTHSNIDQPYLDKVIHGVMFGVLSFLMIVGLKKQHTSSILKLQAVRYTIIICCVYGVIIELIQFMIPGRSMELMDMAANAIGVLFGLFLFELIYKIL